MSRSGSVSIVLGSRIITEGTKSVAAAATPETLVAASTPCKKVWVAAPINDDGTAANTSVVRISLAGTAALGFQILPTDGKGYYISINDAYNLTVRVGTNADSVRYVVLG